MPNVTEYEFAYLDLMKSFLKAMAIVMVDDETEESQAAFNAAFDKAKKYGWDWESDEKWTHWTLKATGPEILAQGLANAIQKCHLR